MFGWFGWELFEKIRYGEFYARNVVTKVLPIAEPNLRELWSPLLVALATGLTAFYFLSNPEGAAQ